jgi:hypothetical protein
MTVLDTAKSPEVVPVEGAQRVTLFLKDPPVRIALDRDAYNSRDVVQRRAVAVHHDETAVVCVDVPDGTTEADTAAALNEAESLLKSADRLYAERNGAADSTQHHVKAWWGARMRKAPKKRTSKAVKAADRS